MDQTDVRDAEWFASRMPSREVLADVLQGNAASRLLGVVRDRAIANEDFDVDARLDAERDLVDAAMKLAVATARKVAHEGYAIPLTAEEREALDLFILLVSRPAILVRDGRVTEEPENWKEIGKSALVLPDIIAGVGRIETASHFKVGTGFIVGERRILTNNHVVEALLGMSRAEHWYQRPNDFAQRCIDFSERWSEETGTAAPYFELRGEFGSTETVQVRVTRILAHHRDVDMAVLELSAHPEGGKQLPLILEEPDPFVGRRIYAVGYPVDDARVNGERVSPAVVFRRIFGEDEASLGMKRFSPGIVQNWANDNEFRHDASTLRGSSGSCIVDFKHRKVVGLHFSGSYREQRNNAIPLWKFRNDPLLIDNGVVFNESAS